MIILMIYKYKNKINVVNAKKNIDNYKIVIDVNLEFANNVESHIIIF